MMVRDIDYTWSDCITCGVHYAVPTALYNHQRQKGGYHFCPNGHQQGWGTGATEMDRLRRERDVAKQQLARAEDEAREAKEKAVREIAAANKVTARLKKRASAGTCPCCQRTFYNMSRHMKTKHAEFVAENVVSIKYASK